MILIAAKIKSLSQKNPQFVKKYLQFIKNIFDHETFFAKTRIMI